MTRILSDNEMLKRFKDADNVIRDLVKMCMNIDINSEITDEEIVERYKGLDDATKDKVSFWMTQDSERIKKGLNEMVDQNKSDEKTESDNLIDFISKYRKAARHNLFITKNTVEVYFEWDPCHIGFKTKVRMIFDFRGDSTHISMVPADSIDSLLTRMGIEPSMENILSVLEIDDWYVHYIRNSDTKEFEMYYHEFLPYDFDSVFDMSRNFTEKFEDLVKMIAEKFGIMNVHEE